MGGLMIYGATGFTARLVMENLEKRGIPFVVAGRDREGLDVVARRFGTRSRVFGLQDADVVARELCDVRVVLNAAGPFRMTAAPLVRACLAVGAHYLDVTGEVSPLALLAKLDPAARARGIMLLPAVGFDVVPSDCLAVYLARRLPGADELTLSIQGTDVLSRGSARTFADHAGMPAYVRRNGELEPMRYRAKLRWSDFGDGYRPTIATSWGDLVTAYRSTGIPNIEVYFEATLPRFMGIAGNQYLAGLFRTPRARSWFRSMADVLPEAHSSSERAQHSARILGQVRKGKKRLSCLMVTSEAYGFTGVAAAAILERVLEGRVRLGFQTPATLFGPNFALRVGAMREIVA